MALRPRVLADKSALVRMPHPSVREVLEPLIMTGDVARCSVVDLEVLFSARHHRDFVEVRDEREDAFPLVDTQQADFDRAVEVMEGLAAKGHHRAVSLPDLVTGQPMRWVVRRGSV